MSLYHQKCPECTSFDLVTDFSAGDLICRNCGIIVGDRLIDESCEWTIYENDDNHEKSRSGNLSDQTEGITLMSVIDKGQNNNNEVKKIATTLATVQSKACLSTQERLIIKINETIKLHCDQLNLSKTVSDQAINIYNKAIEKEIFTRKSDTALAATIFASCRLSGIPRTIKEIETVFEMSKRPAIIKLYKKLIYDLKLEHKSTTCESFLIRFCGLLGLSSKIEKIALNVNKKVEYLGLGENQGAAAMAGAIVYLVAAITSTKKDLKEIAEMSSTAEKTMKKICKNLNKNRMDLFKDILIK